MKLKINLDFNTDEILQQLKVVEELTRQLNNESWKLRKMTREIKAKEITNTGDCIGDFEGS